MSLYRLSLKAIPHRRGVIAGSFVAGFLLTAALLAFATTLAVKSTLAHHAAHKTHALGRSTTHWLDTLRRLGALDQADACSPDFIRRLRLIAFLPDGIHELIYTRDNVIECSVTLGRPDVPIEIGAPDLTLEDKGLDFWFDRNLGLLGQPNLQATFLRMDNYIVVITDPAQSPAPVPWIAQRASFWAALKSAGATAEASDTAVPTAATPWMPSFRENACETNGLLCVDLVVSPAALVAEERLWIVAGGLLSVLLGLIAMLLTRTGLDRLWALPNRLRYMMDGDSLCAAYQPILSIRDDRISGFEVLARWRDVTGETVMPDKFLPLILEGGLSRVFTEQLVRKVYWDLLTLPDHEWPLSVHFNIFPRDFEAKWLLEAFAPLRLLGDRCSIVLEIVESDRLPLEQTHQTVETLREHGILTYVDDFGTGYCNIQYLGHLSVAGVKLDRTFGQAPDGSLMAELLTRAAEMVRSAGFALVVEGVETEDRMEAIRASGLFDEAQGYYIARPLDFQDLVAFLKNREPRHAPDEAKQLSLVV
ncbi:EAL domain-containing protein [Oricola sp.]|uniref:EAL domain-containing protein n=1 Tax=Oricola sp. TaxID=1979950 RepID=UPI0025D16846|nr:EAL domain-containing protein [Oricola sp.]MCI5077556.1 cyclic diguanylate phosphodiesterase [Oricola sp.]